MKRKKKKTLSRRIRRNIYRNRGPITAVIIALFALLLLSFCLRGCGVFDRGDDRQAEDRSGSLETTQESYGVFLGVDASSFKIEDFDGFDLVVVDAQELRREQLAQLHAKGHTVYSYLNVGSIEKNRDYFGQYKEYCLDRYENWPDEYWIDVSQDGWQKFAGDVLPDEILKKDPAVDGLFLDNLDIYSHVLEGKKYRDKGEDVFEGLISILDKYTQMDLPVLINGADVFVQRLIDENRTDLIRGVNQETVFSSIRDYERDKFGVQPKSERTYYMEYLSRCKKAGLDVFLLEYTLDEDVKEAILTYCRKNGFRCYISGHVNLVPSGE